MNNKITLTTLHLGNSRVLGALCQEQDVDQILVLFGGRGRKHTTKGRKGNFWGHETLYSGDGYPAVYLCQNSRAQLAKEFM